MPYKPLDLTVPNGAPPAGASTQGQNGTEVLQSIRDNQSALADASIMGAIIDWAMTVTGANPSLPDSRLWSNGANQLRATYTRGTSGAALNRVVQTAYERSYDSGSTWVTIKTLTRTIDTTGIVSATTWS